MLVIDVKMGLDHLMAPLAQFSIPPEKLSSSDVKGEIYGTDQKSTTSQSRGSWSDFIDLWRRSGAMRKRR